MAAALKKLEDQLNCFICLETYTNPKQLHCQHVYCQQCLVNLINQDKHGQLSLTCPSCRQVTLVPDSGVAGLQTPFCVYQLLEIVKEHKKVARLVLNANNSALYNECGCENFDLYCKTCEEGIDRKCTSAGSHKCEEVNETLKQNREEILSRLESVENHVASIKKTLKRLDARRNRLCSQQASVEAGICSIIAHFHQTLDIRKTELIGQLHKLTQTKFKSLAAQRDQLETTQAQLSSCLSFIRESLETGSKGDMLMMKSSTGKRLKELTTAFQQDKLEPNTKADIIFQAPKNLRAELQNYGMVYAHSLVDPSKCCVTGKGVNYGAVWEKSVAYLQTNPWVVPLSSVECDVISEVTGIRALGGVERKRPSQYKICYQPTIKGRHQLHVKVEGQHIRGSPFLVRVCSPVEKLGSPILSIGGLKVPLGVAVSRRGEVIVTEADGFRVTIFSPRGEKLQSFRITDTNQRKFRCPVGVAVDKEDHIYVADNYNHLIQKFTMTGKFLASVGTDNTAPSQYYYGITINPRNGLVYVVDAEKSCVQILHPDLSYHSTFGRNGQGEGEFGCPTHIACDSTGNVYVVDRRDHCVQVFTAEGEFLRMFGRCGKGRGYLNWPYGVAVDLNHRVYISNEGNHSVSVFTSEGQFLTSFGGCGAGPGQFKYPRGVAVDSSGVVYVCESFNNRVQLF